MDLPVRIADTDEELAEIYRLRYEIYVEQQRKQLPAADHTSRTLKDELDEAATNFYINDEHGILAACGRATIGMWPSIFDNALRLPAFEDFCANDFYYISKVAVTPRVSSSHALSSIFKAMYRHGRSRSIPFGVAHCNPRLFPIYRRYGWRQFGPDFQDPLTGRQMPILIVAPDVSHLRRVKSRLAVVAEEFPPEPQYAGWFERHFSAYVTSLERSSGER
jgi:hypothetical protein